MSYFHQNFITTVIDLYGLELDDHQVDSIIETWLQKYDLSWIVKAIVESLYRGRYKIKSVDNILKDWQRLGQPRYNFTPEYEREILQNLPDLTDRTPTSPPLVSDLDSESEPEPEIEPHGSVTQSARLNSHHLNPEESEPFQYHNHSIPPDRSTDSPLGVIVTVEEPKVATGDCLDTSESDKHASFIYVPTSLAILQGKVYVSSERQNNVTVNRSISHPVKLQLFHTLKAIVDPNNNHHQPDAESLLADDINADCPHYTHFHLPIEEQYL
jgi:hypothetical protein